MLRPNGMMTSAAATVPLHEGVEIVGGDVVAPRLHVLYDGGHEEIVQVIADVLGLTSVIVEEPLKVGAWPSDSTAVLGLDAGVFSSNRTEVGDTGRIVINTRAIDRSEDATHVSAAEDWHFELLYSERELDRRGIVRFLKFVLGQTRPQDEVLLKSQSTMLAVTVSDVNEILSKLDMVTIGADAVEFRVDLLEAGVSGCETEGLVGLDRVAEQLMLLRSATDLPVVFTVRSEDDGGHMRLRDPSLVHQYLRKAIQWGVEFIDVELFLPEKVRRSLAEEKRNTKIISTFHDLSGQFCWASEEAYKLYTKCAEFGDVVKMVALTDSAEEDNELESFRSIVQAQHPHIPFCGLNLSAPSRPSTAMNKVLTPVTHPLMPASYSSSDLTIADLQTKLLSLDQVGAAELYAIEGQHSTDAAAPFMQKLLNELALSRRIHRISHLPSKLLDPYASHHVDFGGVYFSTPIEASNIRFSNFSDAAAQIGQVDVLLPRPASTVPEPLAADNVTWKAIASTLTQDLTASAFRGKTALIIGDQSSVNNCYAAIFALKKLQIGSIFSIGFKAKDAGPLASDVRYLSGIEDLKLAGQPFVIISALPSQRAMGVAPLLKFYAEDCREMPVGRKQKGVVLDLACSTTATPAKTQVSSLAMQMGWTVHGAHCVQAWKVVETLKSLVGKTVGVEIVKKWI